MWRFMILLVMLGIGVPILMNIYSGFVGQNGSWNNWTVAYAVNATTTSCVTAVSTFEMGIFQIIPILAGLTLLGFILYLLSGGFHKPDNMPPIGR